MSVSSLRRQATSLEEVLADQGQRLADVRSQIATLALSDTFDDAAGHSLSVDHVELAVSELDSVISSDLASRLVPRQAHVHLALRCRYVDMLIFADRIRCLATAFGFVQATPFVNALPTLEEWMLSQGSAAISEDELRLRIDDYQLRIKHLQRRFKEVPGLHQFL